MRFELHWHYTDPETSRHDLSQQGRRDDREKKQETEIFRQLPTRTEIRRSIS